MNKPKPYYIPLEALNSIFIGQVNAMVTTEDGTPHPLMTHITQEKLELAQQAGLDRMRQQIDLSTLPPRRDSDTVCKRIILFGGVVFLGGTQFSLGVANPDNIEIGVENLIRGLLFVASPLIAGIGVWGLNVNARARKNKRVIDGRIEALSTIAPDALEKGVKSFMIAIDRSFTDAVLSATRDKRAEKEAFVQEIENEINLIRNDVLGTRPDFKEFKNNVLAALQGSGPHR